MYEGRSQLMELSAIRSCNVIIAHHISPLLASPHQTIQTNIGQT